MFTFVTETKHTMNYENLHLKYKVKNIVGRYLNLEAIESILKTWNTKDQLEVLGFSVQNRPVYKYQIGHGTTKILMWSQMHGNESTTTKGLMDFIQFLQDDSTITQAILNQFTFCIVPMLNPDGAEVYTRVNANAVDLNRDFQDLSQPESRLLMRCYDEFKPDYCYNLHDQRTIFGVGTTGKSATMSFLAPSFNDEKDYDAPRLKAVSVIVNMVKALKVFIPGQIGRFDDEFNINCAGDTFQALKTPTILIEAGHFSDDYDREVTRKFVFIALVSGLLEMKINRGYDNDLDKYLSIPQNIPNFFDFIYKNVKVGEDKSAFVTNFSVQFREELLQSKIVFNAFIAKEGNLEGYFGHYEYDANQSLYTDENDNIPKLDEKANFCLDKKVKIVNGLVKK